MNVLDTVDTDKTTHHAPGRCPSIHVKTPPANHKAAVTHEVLKPTTHHITHEQVTREIHHHDVHHSILPVTDLEILPTKHYVVDPHQPGTLKEIPESAAPATNNWAITPTTNPGLASSPKNSDDGSAAAATTRPRAGEGSPVLINKRCIVTDEGVPRTGYFWRHPPMPVTAAHNNRGDTAPVRLDGKHASDQGVDSLASQQQGQLLSKTPGPASPALNLDELHRRAEASLLESLNKLDSHIITTLNGGLTEQPSHPATESPAEAQAAAVVAPEDTPAAAAPPAATVASHTWGPAQAQEDAMAPTLTKERKASHGKGMWTPSEKSLPPIASSGTSGSERESVRGKVRAKLRDATRAVGRRLKQHS